MHFRRWLSIALLVGWPLAGAGSAELAWPAIVSETKPWARWWWLGSINTEEGLRARMEQYAAAGLGGLEITPIYGVRGYEDQFIPYLSPTWISRLEFVLKEAKRLHLGIDMATTSGWPFGGPWVGPDDAARYLAYRTYTVAAGKPLGEPIQYLEQPVLRFAGPTRVPLEQIKDPVSTNANLQELALDQVRFPRLLPLHTLMAFPEIAGGETAEAGDEKAGAGKLFPAAGVDLTSKVRADGSLNWTAPEGAGTWTLYAIFAGWHGKMVERAGPGGEGSVIDHFSSGALRSYLRHFDEAFAGHGLSGLRSFFNDSYEVDDAEGESNFTPRFFDEFIRRRGYDLREHLPALIAGLQAPPAPEARGRRPGGSAADPQIGARRAPVALPDEEARVLTDFRETISDLLLDQFTIPWEEWAGTKGALIRNQAHGSPANILDLYAASGIPEQEGGDPIRLKFASSAAHVTGKRLASSETATWLTEHFITTLAEVKQRVDLTFLGGINHIFYHGTAYSPPDDPWPGFQFYASVEFNPSNSWWGHFPALNEYVARVQSFLQAGEPAESVLLYYPIHDTWAAGGGHNPHFGGPQGTSAQVAREMWQAGFTFDFVSDRMLAEVTMENGALQAAQARYEAIVVPHARLMPLPTLHKLLDLAGAGATVVFVDGPPADVPGLGDLAARRAKFRELTAAFQDMEAGPPGLRDVPWGKGRLVTGDNVDQALAWIGVAPEPFAVEGLQFVRRRAARTSTYFIVNTGTAAVAKTIQLRNRGKSAALFDPLTGRFGILADRAQPDGSLMLRLQLEPGASRILLTSDEPLSGPAYDLARTAGDPQPLAGTWRVDFIDGGPELPGVARITELKSWTEFGGELVKSFSGTARYALDFPKPDGIAEWWLLDLGRVAESARVKLNGAELGVVFMPPYRVRIPAKLFGARNTLEIEVANLMANRIADLDRRGVVWKKFYNTNLAARVGANRGTDGNFSAAKWVPRESGLLGPVTLTPLAPSR